MNDTFITVDAHDVNHGDLLAGVSHATGRPVGSILWDASIQSDGTTRGAWIYGDVDGQEIDRRPLGARVQVVRGVVEGAGHKFAATPSVHPGKSDDAPSTATSPGPCSPDDSRVADGPPVSPASSDWCDPHGITRGPGGLWMVVP